MAKTVPDNDLMECLGQVCNVMANTMAFIIFEGKVAPAMSTGQVPEVFISIMHNAVLDSVLFNVRCLDEFFTDEDGRPDDVRARHFKGCGCPQFLTKDERISVNKCLAHISTERWKTSFEGWEIDTIVRRALQSGSRFLEMVTEKSGLQLSHEIAYQRQAVLELAGLCLRGLS